MGSNIGFAETWCTFCQTPLGTERCVADNWVYKCGELSYIELAHVDCVDVEWADRFEHDTCSNCVGEDRFDVEESDGPAGDFISDFWFNAEGPDEPFGLGEEF